jgi:hypothetical protein
MAYPFESKEISRQKDVKIQVLSDIQANLPHFDSNGNRSSFTKVAVPKGEYIAEKVISERFFKKDNGTLGASTGEKLTHYLINIPIETGFNVAPLTPYSVPISPEIKELATEKKNFFTPTNIFIGLAIIGAVVGILKWKKVF